MYHISIISIIFKVYQYLKNNVNYSTLRTPLTHVLPKLIEISNISQSSSIYNNSRNKTTASSENRKHYYRLTHRETLSSPEVQTINEQFNSRYCNTLFDYCHICVSDFCHEHKTIKYTGECQRVFHVICYDIVNNKLINNRKKMIHHVLKFIHLLIKIKNQIQQGCVPNVNIHYMI